MEQMDAMVDSAIHELNNFEAIALEEHSEALIKVAERARQSKTFFIGGIIISFLGILSLSVFFSKFITQPITKLNRAMEFVEKRDFSHRISIRTGDEFEELAASFNYMAEQLQELYDKLQQKVAERTAALEATMGELYQKKGQLEQSNVELERERLALLNLSEDLEETNKRLIETQAKLIQLAKMAAVGELVGGVAHEINSPLTGVLNNVQLIKLELKEKKGFKASEFKELLGVVEESALRCKRIIQRLLEFSRAGQGERQPISVNEALEKTLLLIEREIGLGNIKIIKALAKDLPLVMAEPNRLQQVFLDILINAKWALRQKDGAAIRIKTSLSEDKKIVAIEIADNGCGIEKENISRIFEPFFTTKKPGEGTGLGLSICYEIIKEHNGSIEAESEGKDKGAIFRINLPAMVNV